MTVNSKPYYWLECDSQGCESQFPGDTAEFSALMYEGDLADSSSDSDWLTVKLKTLPTLQPRSLHFCPEHSVFHCRECGEPLTSDEQDAGEYECFKCRPELSDVPGE